MKITSKEIILATVFAMLGFILSAREYILFLSTLNPVYGLGIFYGVVFIAIFILSKVGLVVGGMKLGSLKQTLGSVLIIFAFFILFAASSAYINLVSTGQMINNIFQYGTTDNVSIIYLQTEDGAVWWAWSFITNNIDILRILTYSVTPFMLTLLGGLLVSRKPKLK